MWYEAAARYIEEKKSEDNSLLLLLTSQSSRLDKMKSLLGLLEKKGVVAPLLCTYDVSDDVPVDVLAKTDVLITTKSFRSHQYWY